MGVRVECATTGIDDAVQGLSSDPYGSIVNETTGLRIPTFRPDNFTRYLFLLATRVITRSTRVRGLRQYLTLGAQAKGGGGEAPSQTVTVEFPVSTPNFYLQDANVSWHLVEEPNPYPLESSVPLRGSTDSTNFMQGNSDGPALLYNQGSPTWAGAQPLYYFNGMTAYAPPVNQTQEWQPIGGLGNMHDIRFPWSENQAWQSLDVPICARSQRRVSLYASVLQTAGAVALDSANATLGLPPEQTFINAMADLSFGSVFLWKVAGAIIFEDYDKDCDCEGA